MVEEWTDNEFKLLWVDHFDSFDDSRWEKAEFDKDGSRCHMSS